ncbi:uncharacterized protein LOC143072048 [Mytilus galloprovincialis]|uniref:uncharacterized protein LOC143072048 n=1 Tax=Mytilus galloprovincialis TaxID=29158 RepID=UPI003F7C6BED
MYVVVLLVTMDSPKQFNTPKKSSKVCCVCGITPKEKRSVNGENKAGKNISELLARYGQITVSEGCLCRSCYEKLLKIDQTVVDFRKKCQSSKPGVKRCLNDITSMTNIREVNGSHISCASSPLSVAVSLFQTPNSGNSRSQVAVSLFQTPVVKSNIESPVTPALQTINPKPVKRSLLDDSGYMSSPTCPSPIAVSIMPSPLVKQTDHCYSKNVTSTPKPKSTPVALQSSTVNAPVTNEGADENITVRVPSLSKTEKAHLASLLHAGGYISHIGDLLLKNKDFLKHVTNNFKTESEEKMKILNKEKHGFVSVLMKKTCDNMYGFSWGQICEEFKSQFPVLASIVEGVMSSGEKNRDKILPRMGMVYAVCAQTRHHKLSLVQRMMTLCLLDNIADQKPM